MFPFNIGISLLLSTIQVSDPTVYVMGQESKIAQFKVERITTKKKFLDTWAKHHGVEPTQLDPQVMPYMFVNFETHEVVAVFAGHKIESAGVVPIKVVKFLGKTLVIYKQSKYTALDFVPEGHPYAFIVIPRLKGEIIVIEQMQKWLGGKEYEYTSKERARLPLDE